MGTKEALEYAGFDSGELNMMFHFEHMELCPGPYGKWNVNPVDLVQLKQVLSRWQQELDGRAWNSLFWENHDYPRVVSRFGNDGSQYRELSAKMLAICLYLMKGTPYVYQGQELGMTNCDFQELKDFRDIEIHQVYREMVEGGKVSHEEMMGYIRHTGRDNARTPMQWDDSAHGGFTEGTPWIRENQNYKRIHAKEQVAREDSVYGFYQKLFRLRKASWVVKEGTYCLLLPEHPGLFVYERAWEGERMLVACNFTDQWQELKVPGWGLGEAKLWLGNYETAPEGTGLRPYEGAAWTEGNHIG